MSCGVQGYFPEIPNNRDSQLAKARDTMEWMVEEFSKEDNEQAARSLASELGGLGGVPADRLDAYVTAAINAAAWPDVIAILEFRPRKK